MSDQKTYWYVVYTRPRWEKKVAGLLEDKGIAYYCPLNKVVRQWSDRKKTILEPLFKGYVFVRPEEENRLDLLQINGIVNYVYWLGKPAKVRDSEIDIIRRFLNEFNDITVTENDMKISSQVLVKQGVLMHYKGIVLELQGNGLK